MSIPFVFKQWAVVPVSELSVSWSARDYLKRLHAAQLFNLKLHVVSRSFQTSAAWRRS